MATSKIELPTRQRKYRFALTPLADAMFQLLIFFMLTSSLTPYSLLTLQTAEAPQEQSNAAMPGAESSPAEPASDTEIAIWALEADAIVVGGQTFGFDALGGLATALGASGRPAEVILLVRDTARIQDVTTVLERLRGADVASVRVTQGAR